MSFPSISVTHLGGDPVFDDLDAETASLIARLALEDLDEAINSRKGKSRADFQPTDEELAYQLQSQQYQAWLTVAEDFKFAKSIGDALSADANYLEAFIASEEAAAADRVAAERLSRGEALPPRTTSQTKVEDRAFVMHPEPPPKDSTFDILSQDDDTSSDGSSTIGFNWAKPAPRTTRKTVSSLWGQATAGPGVNRNKTIDWANDDASSSSDGSSIIGVDWSTPAPRTAKDIASPRWSHFLEGAAGPSVNRNKTVKCTICNDSLPHRDALHTPCDHQYCKDCVVSLVDHFTKDESLFPLRCCQSPIPVSDVIPFISSALKSLFLAKHAEFSVLSKDRIYCAIPTCSTFLGSSEGLATSAVQCPRCRQSTCPRCKQAAHGDEDCVVNASTIQLRALARQLGWQTCPGCHTLVELQIGCYHMTCRCRTQFCYLCAVPWKGCTCPQWEERRLLETAQLRVENELGAQALRNTRADALRLRVQERVRTLRQNHDCQQHSWRYRHGGGRCEECHFELPQYLLICQMCSLLACVRCSRNRL